MVDEVTAKVPDAPMQCRTGEIDLCVRQEQRHQAKQVVKDFATSPACSAAVLSQLFRRLTSCEVKEMVKGRKMNVRDLGNPARRVEQLRFGRVWPLLKLR